MKVKFTFEIRILLKNNLALTGNHAYVFNGQVLKKQTKSSIQQHFSKLLKALEKFLFFFKKVFVISLKRFYLLVRCFLILINLIHCLLDVNIVFENVLIGYGITDILCDDKASLNFQSLLELFLEKNQNQDLYQYQWRLLPNKVRG